MPPHTTAFDSGRTDDAPPRPIDLEAGRRAFLRTSGLAAAGAAAFGLSGPAAAQSADIDQQILNFALTTEYLGAEFYLRAATGSGLPDSEVTGQGTLGGVIGGRQVPFQDPVIAAFANEVAQDELGHVRFLRRTLKSAKVARPTIDLQNSFTAAAVAAGLLSPGQTFDPFADDLSFAIGAYIFNDVDVTAYNGAAPLITDKSILQAASSILAVEGYHAAIFRTVLFQKGAYTQTALISNLRAVLSGATIDQGVGPDQSTYNGGPQTPSNIVPSDANGLAFTRTPRQVLNVVYGKPGARKGQFFPDGINGYFDGDGGRPG